jgi:hypothetical protein
LDYGKAVAGFYLAFKSPDIREVLFLVAWVGAIGYAFGTIFDQHHSSGRLVMYWTVTLALVSPFFSPALPGRRLP